MFQTNNENQHNMAPKELASSTQSHIRFLSMVTNEQKSFGDPLSEPPLLAIGVFANEAGCLKLFWGLNVLYLIAQRMLLCKLIFTEPTGQAKISTAGPVNVLPSLIF